MTTPTATAAGAEPVADFLARGFLVLDAPPSTALVGRLLDALDAPPDDGDDEAEAPTGTSNTGKESPLGSVP